MKDLNTIELLPEIVRSGVSSLKIEGRMKKAEYAAGVTSIYRKYLDRVLKDPDAPYRVSAEDLRHLFRLFNREGFTEGFLRHTAPESRVAVHEKGFRAEEEDFLRFVRENYIDKNAAASVRGHYRFLEGMPASLSIETVLSGRRFSVEAVSEKCPVRAERSPLTKAQAEERFSKMGGTGFRMDEIHGDFEEGLFLPVSDLNEMRRQAVRNLREAILSACRRASLNFPGGDR